MKINKLRYIFSLFFLVICTNIFSQDISATFEITAGSNNICEGSLIQLGLVDIDPASDSYFYTWSLQTPNDNTPQQIFDNAQTPGSGSGNGDDHTFVRLNLTVPGTNTITVRVGNLTLSEDFEVTEAVTAGQGNTLFLCNQSGSIDLFSLIDDGDSGGVWTYNDAAGNTQIDTDGFFEVGGDFNNPIDEPNIFTYTVTGTFPCPDSNTTVIIRPCSDDDYDNDGVPNASDLDNDNDGILDSEENQICISGSIDLTPTQLSIDEDFGVGPTTQNRFVASKLLYEFGIPQDTSGDGEYNVATSSYLYNFNNESAFYVATELNEDEDGDGNPNGRYLAINMTTGSFLPSGGDNVIYEQTDIPVTGGVESVLSMKVANLNGGQPGQVPPSLRIEIVDSGGGVLEFVETGEVASNNDLWQEFPLFFTASTTESVVSLRVLNLQTTQGPGNDIGIDNILLSRLECDFDGDGVPNYLDLDSDNDGIYDAVEAGIDPMLIQDNGTLTTTATDVGADGIPTAAGGGFTPLNDNYLNTDSDGDGCSDANEAYNDSEADGLKISTTTFETEAYGIDTFDPADMVDFDGRVLAASYDFSDIADLDNNTIDDYTEDGPYNGTSTIPRACEESEDHDEDLVLDVDDLDDDNDGILDTAEYGGVDPLTDADGDGVPVFLDDNDADDTIGDVDGSPQPDFDFDGDGIPNHFDVDSDNDGIYDHVEAGLALYETTNEDAYGQIGLDEDVDADGLLAGSGLATDDFDTDGLPNFLDIDADGDGILDNYEAQLTDDYTAPSGMDADENGADDAYDGDDALNPIATATDVDYLNENSDDDCLDDTTEAYDADGDGIADITTSGMDTDNNGLDNAFEGNTSLIADLPNNHNPETAAVDYREEFAPIEEDVVADAVCNNDDATAINLYDLLIDLSLTVDTLDDLNVDLGEWSAATGTATITNGVIEPSVLDAGSYVFEYLISYAIDCEHTYTIALEVIEEPYVGEDDQIDGPTVCDTDETDVEISPFASIELAAADTVSENGIWTVSSGDSAAVSLPVLAEDYNDPITIDTSMLSLGDEIILTYEVGSEDATDCFASIDVLVVITEGRDAGPEVSDLGIFCGDDDLQNDLLVELGNVDDDGTWTATFDDGSGATDITSASITNILDPEELYTNYGGGSYQYVYILDPTDDGCEGDSATINFVIIAPPSSGTATSTMAVPICSDTGVISLFDDAYLTGEDAGGVWTDASDVEVLDGEVDVNMLSGELVYTYTVGAADCSAITEVSINVSEAPVVDTTTNTSFCGATTNTGYDLFTLIGTTSQTGTWTSATAGVTVNGSLVSPMELAGLGSGDYQFDYNIPMNGGCEEVDLLVTITIDENLNSGDTQTLAECINNLTTTYDLTEGFLDAQGDVTAGGEWSSTDNSATAAGIIDGINDFATGEYVYTYTVGIEGDPDCPQISTDYTLNLTEDREAGDDVVIPSFCAEDIDVIDLHNYLEVTDADGVWTPIAALTGGYLGTLDVSTLTDGSLNTFTYTLPANGDCEPDSVVVTVEILDEITEPTLSAGNTAFGCEGNANPTLTVDLINTDQIANWYNEDGTIFLDSGTSYSPTDAAPGTYIYQVTAVENGCESAPVQVNFEIIPAPIIDSFPDLIDCVDLFGELLNPQEPFTSQNTDGNYTFQWFRDGVEIVGETAESYPPQRTGVYYLEYTSINNCGSWQSEEFEIIGIEEPELELSLGDGQFSNEPSIVAAVINASEFSEYEYILDGTITQSESIFENVEPGFHTVEVIDLYACGSVIADIYVVGFPKFFTPNGDGTNEFWNVDLDPTDPMIVSIFIYDRFGKMLKQVRLPDDVDLGWDGTFGGRDLPSTDYWFKAVLEETGEAYTGHFSLIR